ncbi:Mo-dependent nitrogenase-like protein [Nostoc sp. NIES-3756]|uniref:Mo-dependent nitrogenase C-terminal domain-containing protein n=1 Tax=Nostoc sp. NIES-3756 TaxID=1751286 RepID=UPI000722F293|nr:Mo-dependent nitrogenase C-terminal domain-containing protein [Nostoc sp. NIES-3756]BAT51336.1 Mo-dependent nitrogenase-like protein [Nostoc sp. NIES-3756]BAY40949.1 Mo-dependent nitrogenase-like protein [Nostoc sp. NIES-2111]
MMSTITVTIISVINLLLQPIRQWLESLKIESPKLARQVCTLIPASCPFEREIKLGDRTLIHIPPLCKLNPFYEQLVEIRFKALMYLADECGEDVTQFC